MSDPPTTCPHCDTVLPNDSPQALCPSCLLKQAFFTQAPSSGDRGQIDLPPSPETIADKFPQFEITECLGRGGMGVVYKARQKSLKRWVAIKILAPEKVSDPRFAERFTAEAQILGMLNHNNIVKVFDHGETRGLYYIVMEYIDGINLRDFLNHGHTNADQALKIVAPICEALQYAHDKRIVHRDIKPENILIDNENRIKVADFGIASLIDSIGETAGTPPYMAPEQHALTGVDHRADIYALGTVLYEMLTGERPDTPLDLPSQKVELDIRIDDIVLRALSKEPERRYQTAYDFKNVVKNVVASQGTTTPTSSESAPNQAQESTSEKELEARSTKASGGVLLVIGALKTHMPILTTCSILVLMISLTVFAYVDRLDMMHEETTETYSDPSSIARTPILEANNELKTKNDIADTMSASANHRIEPFRGKLLSLTQSMNAGRTITVDSQEGWQEYEFSPPVSMVTGITGGWTVDKNIYIPVGAHGHQGSAAQALKRWKQYKFDQKHPFGALMVDLGSTGRSQSLTGPLKFNKKITKLRIRINDEALGDNKGKLVVTFE